MWMGWGVKIFRRNGNIGLNPERSNKSQNFQSTVALRELKLGTSENEVGRGIRLATIASRLEAPRPTTTLYRHSSRVSNFKLMIPLPFEAAGVSYQRSPFADRFSTIFSELMTI
jgi:hypothetical protein